MLRCGKGPGYFFRVQEPPPALIQFCCSSQFNDPNETLYIAPLEIVDVVPNFQAHLSAFSLPRRSNQALRSGSVTLSDSSWAMRFAMPSAPTLPFGEVVWAEQADGHCSGFPTNPYLMSRPLIVP